MSKEISEVTNKVKRLRQEIFRAKSSFRAYEVLQESRAPNLIGNSDAERNAKAVGDYKGFMNIAEHALNTEFLVSLAKLFDEHKDGTSIPKLLNYLEGNIKKLTKEDFAEFIKDDPDAGIKLQEYAGIKIDDIREMRKTLSGLETSITKLMGLRDKRIAHLEVESIYTLNEESAKDVDSTKGKVEDLTYGEIHSLITSADELLNKISSLVYKDIAYFKPLEEAVTDDSSRLLSLIRKTYDSEPHG
jgi:hypothetical protein